MFDYSRGCLTPRQKRCVQVPMTEADEAAFEEMAADDAFGEQVIRDIRAVRAQFRQPEMAFGTYQAEGPAWMQHMLGWPGSDAISQSGPQIPLQNLALNPWAEPLVEPWHGQQKTIHAQVIHGCVLKNSCILIDTV